MAHLKNLVVNGNSRTIGTVYASDYVGKVNGYPIDIYSGDGINTTDTKWSAFGITNPGIVVKAIRTNQNVPSWALGEFSSGIAFGGGILKVFYLLDIVNQVPKWLEVMVLSQHGRQMSLSLLMVLIYLHLIREGMFGKIHNLNIFYKGVVV